MPDYVYDCKGKEITLTDEKTMTKHGRFLVCCNQCCNVTVVHLLRVKRDDRSLEGWSDIILGRRE